MCETHRKTRESHPKRQKRTYTAKNNVFHSVQEIFSEVAPPPPQVFQIGGGGAPPAFRRTRNKTLRVPDCFQQPEGSRTARQSCGTKRTIVIKYGANAQNLPLASSALANLSGSLVLEGTARALFS